MTDDLQQSQSTGDLANLTAQTSQLTNSIRTQVTALNNSNKKSQPGDADFKTRKSQIANLQNSFKKALQEYQEVEKKSRDKYRQRMERQIRIGSFFSPRPPLFRSEGKLTPCFTPDSQA